MNQHCNWIVMAQLQLKCFRSLWGTPSAARLGVAAGHKPHEFGRKLLAHVRSQGYDGIEASLSDLDALGGLATARELLREHDLNLIVGVYSGWVDYEDENLAQQFEGVSTQLARYRQQLERVAAAFPDAADKPVWLNAHSGADRWRQREQMEFFAHAQEIEQQLGFADCLSHETHRGRVLYSPWSTLELLEAFPSLKLTLDFSHWCVVSERLLDTDEDNKWMEESVLPHVYHVHGRIGSVQSAQLAHPDHAGVSGVESERFERLWSAIWTQQQQRLDDAHELHGLEPDAQPFATFTPEYGPIPYAPRHHEDVETEAYDVDALCAARAAQERVRFAKAVGRSAERQ